MKTLKRKSHPVTCDQCQLLAINGLTCHEQGCPNAKKTWIIGRGWIRFLPCFVCGCDVEEGEVCCSMD